MRRWTFREKIECYSRIRTACFCTSALQYYAFVQSLPESTTKHTPFCVNIFFKNFAPEIDYEWSIIFC